MDVYVFHALYFNFIKIHLKISRAKSSGITLGSSERSIFHSACNNAPHIAFKSLTKAFVIVLEYSKHVKIWREIKMFHKNRSIVCQ